MSTPRPPERATSAQRVPGKLTLMTVAMYDLWSAAVSMGLAVWIRYIIEQKDAPPFIYIQSITVFLITCMVVFPVNDLHRGVWRYTALNDIWRIVRAVGAANLIFLPILFLINRLDGFPRTSMLIEIPLLLALMIGGRFAVALWRTRGLGSLLELEDRSRPAAILVGAESELDGALRGFELNASDTPFRVKALVAPGSHLGGRSIRGVAVLDGLDDLPEALKSLKRAENEPLRLVYIGKSQDVRLVNTLIRIAAQTGAKLTRSRPGEGPAAFSPIEAADLLNRPPNEPDLEPARALIEGRRILVTGAGGTIGGQLVRQVLNLGPETITLLDSSENNLYQIDMDVAGRCAEMDVAPRWRAVLADVRDTQRLEQVFAEEQPHVVLHAAALKHVPLSEANPAEAVQTNLLGTIRTIEAARRQGVDVVAVISTDKAVEPSNIMGASKRAAELYARSASRDPGGTRICVVRFGNVLGSSGSVAPLFERQIEAGGPVTVTDPEATRYFMTVEEATGLVLAAAAQTGQDDSLNGALYVLDMGEPVSILGLARQLIRLRGKDPDAPGAIAIIGLRPGEKRHEKLVYEYERTRATDIGGVRCVSGPTPEGPDVDAVLKRLSAAAEIRDLDRVRAELDDIASLKPVASGHTPPRSRAGVRV